MEFEGGGVGPLHRPRAGMPCAGRIPLSTSVRGRRVPIEHTDAIPPQVPMPGSPPETGSLPHRVERERIIPALRRTTALAPEIPSAFDTAGRTISRMKHSSDQSAAVPIERRLSACQHQNRWLALKALADRSMAELNRHIPGSAFPPLLDRSMRASLARRTAGASADRRQRVERCVRSPYPLAPSPWSWVAASRGRIRRGRFSERLVPVERISHPPLSVTLPFTPPRYLRAGWFPG